MFVFRIPEKGTKRAEEIKRKVQAHESVSDAKCPRIQGQEELNCYPPRTAECVLHFKRIIKVLTNPNLIHSIFG